MCDNKIIKTCIEWDFSQIFSQSAHSQGANYEGVLGGMYDPPQLRHGPPQRKLGVLKIRILFT